MNSRAHLIAQFPELEEYLPEDMSNNLSGNFAEQLSQAQHGAVNCI